MGKRGVVLPGASIHGKAANPKRFWKRNFTFRTRKALRANGPRSAFAALLGVVLIAGLVAVLFLVLNANELPKNAETRSSDGPDASSKSQSNAARSNKSKDEDKFQSGLVLTPENLLKQLPKPGFATPQTLELPQTVDLSPNFPQPGDQGQQSSCAAWAVAYSLKSYQESVEMRWSPQSPQTTFSPSFIYNQINNRSDNGSTIYHALTLLKNSGCATLSTCPYNDQDYLTRPTGEASREALSYKIQSFGRIVPNDLTAMKRCISTGHPLVVAVHLPDYFKTKGLVLSKIVPGFTYKIDQNASISKTSGHAMCIVGYDDSRNAFRVINSWGTIWGNSGYLWIDYSTFSMIAYEVYFAVDEKTYGVEKPVFPPGNEAIGKRFKIRISRWNWAESDWNIDSPSNPRPIKLIVSNDNFWSSTVYAPIWPLSGERGEHSVISDLSFEIEFDAKTTYSMRFEEFNWLPNFDISAKPNKKYTTPNVAWPWGRRIDLGGKSWIETVVEAVVN